MIQDLAGRPQLVEGRPFLSDSPIDLLLMDRGDPLEG
jgi:hypothetical protein